MATRVLLTVDTELVWRHHAAGLSWQENLKRSYHAAGVGVPYQLKVLADHGLKACFFVDPMPALVHGLDPVRAMVEPILAAGQEVQLHVHPFWAHLERAEREGRCPELIDFDPSEQRDLIAQAQQLLIAAGAPAPIAFRAGSYAADAATLAALPDVGISYDSSHNGSHPAFSRLPLDSRQVTPVAVAGVTELPVGQIEESPGRLRHLQICAVSASELTSALTEASRERHPVVTIVSHSFELATRDGLRRNRIVQRRFLRLCRLLAQRREELPTCWFRDLANIELGAPGRPPVGKAAPRLGRLAGQVWSNTRYEEPTTAALAASATAAAMFAAIADAG
jgi:hypothetical protein